MEETAFLVFALGFFIFVIWMVVHTTNADRAFEAHRSDVEYGRRLTEAREFKYDPDRLNPKTSKKAR